MLLFFRICCVVLQLDNVFFSVRERRFFIMDYFFFSLPYTS
ncbi:hypothetical protein A464_599 [Salmonella bongori N268-08]|uniref:Uncharacterized protein n=1 Tax=Salmonella bongori N268-08 TaxID=1197719 RepID=S5N5M6_SALBN|nr:hypothetical protein A464_599 [Salmonella bongori N268-08]